MSAAGILAGYGADLVLGDPARRHPTAAFGRLAAGLERRVWRPHRAAGALYAGGLVLGAGAVAHLAGRRARGRRAAQAALLSATVWATLGGRSLGGEARSLATLLEGDDLVAARTRVRALVGRDAAELGAEELSRAAIESVAENTADAVVGPLLYAALGGPGAAAAYRAANTLDAMVGHRSPHYERFGWAAARLDDALTWPAARLGAALAVALAPLTGGSAGHALRILRRDGAGHPSPNAGRLEAAFAGALDLRLGGTNAYAGRLEHHPAMGDGRSPGPADLRRAVRLSALVGAGAALGSAAAAGVIGR